MSTRSRDNTPDHQNRATRNTSHTPQSLSSGSGSGPHGLVDPRRKGFPTGAASMVPSTDRSGCHRHRSCDAATASMNDYFNSAQDLGELPIIRPAHCGREYGALFTGLKTSRSRHCPRTRLVSFCLRSGVDPISRDLAVER